MEIVKFFKGSDGNGYFGFVVVIWVVFWVVGVEFFGKFFVGMGLN